MCCALAKRRRRVANRSRADIASRCGAISRGVMGHRGSAHYVCSGTQAICHSLHIVFAWRSWSVPGTYERLPRVRNTWRHHVAGRQRCSPPAQKDQRTLGVDPSAYDVTRTATTDLYTLSLHDALPTIAG